MPLQTLVSPTMLVLAGEIQHGAPHHLMWICWKVSAKGQEQARAGLGTSSMSQTQRREPHRLPRKLKTQFLASCTKLALPSKTAAGRYARFVVHSSAAESQCRVRHEAHPGHRMVNKPHIQLRPARHLKAHMGHGRWEALIATEMGGPCSASECHLQTAEAGSPCSRVMPLVTNAGIPGRTWKDCPSITEPKHALQETTDRMAGTGSQ